MLSHSQPESTSNQLSDSSALLVFKDGIGIKYGNMVYTMRASNLLVNTIRMAKLAITPLAYFASSMQGASAFQDAQSFQVKGTDFRFWAESWDFHGNKLGDLILNKLRAGMCNVVPIDQFSGWGDDCIDMRTTEHFWLFSIDSSTQTTCANIYRISKCIADFALEYNQTSTINPSFAPNDTTTGYTPPPPTDSNDISSYFTPVVVSAIATVTGACALAGLGFFGRKLYQKCSANSGYAQVPTGFHVDSTDPENFKCPVHLDFMKKPQELICGHNVDLSSWKDIEKHDNCKCPLCRVVTLKPKPNKALKKAIEEYVKAKKDDVAVDILNEEKVEKSSSNRCRVM